MSATPLLFLEDFQTRLSRAQSLARQVQTLALGADVENAGDDLDMIDAISEAMFHRLQAMIDDVETAHARLMAAAEHIGPLSEALAGFAGEAGQHG